MKLHRKGHPEEGPFVNLISGADAELVTPNGLIRINRDPPDNAAVGNRAFGGRGEGTEQQTARGIKGGE